MADFREPHHLPKVRGDRGSDPKGLPRQRRGTTPQMHGRYPDYDVLAELDHWDDATRKAVLPRVEQVPERAFFTEPEFQTLEAFANVVLHQPDEPRIPALLLVDAKLAAGKGEGYQYADMPDDRSVWQIVARGLAQSSFATADEDEQHELVKAFSDGKLEGGPWEEVDVTRAWSVVMRDLLSAFYSHPWAWNEIGFGGPAYPRGYARLGIGLSEEWEGAEAFDLDPGHDVDERGLE